ncbi:hypothetical protein D3C72_2186330 [compost metagenome]
MVHLVEHDGRGLVDEPAYLLAMLGVLQRVDGDPLGSLDDLGDQIRQVAFR